MSLHEDLKAYLDGELDSIRMEEVRSALERDPVLRRELSEIESLQSDLKRHIAIIQPHGLEQTLAALDKSPKPLLQSSYRFAWASGLAVAAIALCVYLIPKNRFDEATAGDASASAASVATPVSPSTSRVAMNTPEEVGAAAKTHRSASGFMEEERKSLSKIVPRDAAKAKVDTESLRAVKAQPEANVKSFKTSSASRPKGFQAAREAAPSLVAPKVTAKPSEITDQVIALAFPSVEQGQQQVLELVGKYRSSKSDEQDSTVTASSMGAKNVITVDLPADAAETLVVALKALPSHQTEDASGVPAGKQPKAEIPVPVAKAQLNTVDLHGEKAGNTSVTVSAAKAPTSSRMAAKKVETSHFARAGAAFGGAVRAKQPDQPSGRLRAAGPSGGRFTGTVTLSSAPVQAQKPKTRRVVIVLTELPKSKGKS